MMGTLKMLVDGIGSLFKWWVILAVWERALRVRGGKHTALLGPGVHFRIPMWDKIYVQPVRLRVTNCPAQTLSTRDNKVISLQLLLQYQVEDLRLMYETLHRPGQLAVAFAVSSASEFVRQHDSEDVNPEEVITHVKREVIPKLVEFGFTKVDVMISNFAYVRIHRLITGDMEAYVGSDHIPMGHDRQKDY